MMVILISYLLYTCSNLVAYFLDGLEAFYQHGCNNLEYQTTTKRLLDSAEVSQLVGRSLL